MTRARFPFLILLAVVTPLGFGAKLYAGPGAYWTRAHAAGLLYEMFWIFLVLLAHPGLRPWRVAAGVFAVTCGLETLQLWHPPFLETLRSTALGAALLGATFSWWDFPHYAVGSALGGWIARAAQPGVVVSHRSAPNGREP